MFETRRKKLAKNILKAGKNVVIIKNPSNLYYYTGFTGGDGMFLLPITENEKGVTDKKNGTSQLQGYLITDSRYYEQVEKECPDLTLIRLDNRRYSAAVKDLLDNLATQGAWTDSLRKDSKTGGCIAIESTMSLAQYLKLQEVCTDYTFEITSDEIMECRMVKDEAEIAKIAEAEAIGDAAFRYILDLIKPGITEYEISLELEFFMKRQGASKLSFDTIVASGPNSSMPHAQVTHRKIQTGDFVTMDFGCVYEGYCSDMTRTIAVGTPTEEMKQVYQIVLDANMRALEVIREGVPCNDIDAIARDYIAQQGYDDYFGHGLGHGVGLDIHEEPRFSSKCKVITKENMVITDEPGIYLPGKFGVRIEDLVVVQKNGCKILSTSDKQLIIL